MNSINDIQDSIISEFSIFDDWMDKYNLLIDYGKDLPAIDPKFKTKDYLIEGCQSKVWLKPDYNGQAVTFSADSDAIITRGIIGLLIKVLSGRTPDELLAADLYFIDRIGLKQNLSPTRSNGLLSMVRQMKLYAMAFREMKNKT
ncbi:MAG TPA: SufE family protein [Bacteroidales bacterium]|nr:SufE family protein [Bacteroidales bacterium]